MHPHVYKLPNLTYAFDQLLSRDDRLRLVLDTAHLLVGGMDPSETLTTYVARVIAVHLKDWGPWFGRSFHRYAQGFTELGHGSVPLERVLDTIRSVAFKGWLILEQDTKSTSAEFSVNQSVSWLQQRGYGASSLRSLPLPPVYVPAQRTPPTDRTPPGLPILLDAIVNSVQTPDVFPRLIVEGTASLAPCRLVCLWAHCPSQHALTLLSSYPTKLAMTSMKVDECHCGRTIHRKRITLYPNLHASPYPAPLSRRHWSTPSVSPPSSASQF